jgi:hypothetical protein
MSSELRHTCHFQTLTSFMLEFYCPTSLKIPNMHYILLLHFYFPLSVLFSGNYSNFSRSGWLKFGYRWKLKRNFFTVKPRLALDNCHISICDFSGRLLKLSSHIPLITRSAMLEALFPYVIYITSL